MANTYVIYSRKTFEELALPAWVARVHGWPDEQVIPEEYDEYEEEPTEEVSFPWTLKEGYELLGLQAGECIPVVDDNVNLIRSNFEEATDFVVPYGSVGGDFHMFLKSLADAKPIAYEACVKSVKQMRELLKVPEPI